MRPRLKLIGFATATLLLSLPPLSPIVALEPLAVPAQTSQQKQNKAEADRLLKQGVNQYKQNQFTVAIQSWQAALTLYRQLQDDVGIANALQGLEYAYRALGDYPKVVEYKQQLSSPELAILATLFLDLSSLPSMPSFSFVPPRPLAGSVASVRTKANQLFQKGMKQYQNNQLDVAIDLWWEALPLYRQVEDKQGEAKVLNQLGHAKIYKGNYSSAVEDLLMSRDTAQDIQDYSTEASAIEGLGLTYFALRNYPKALQYYEQGLTVARKYKNTSVEGQVLGGLGNTYRDLKNYPKALQYYEQGLTIALKHKNTSVEGWILGNVGNLYYALRDYPKALKYQQQDLEIARKLSSTLSEAQSLASLGNTYLALGDYSNAIKYERQSLVISRQLKNELLEGMVLIDLGLALRESGNLAAAAEALDDGTRVWDNIPEPDSKDDHVISFLEMQVDTYRILQEILIAQNKTDDALKISERSRTRASSKKLGVRINSETSIGISLSSISLEQIQQIAKVHNSVLVEYSLAINQEKHKPELYIWVIQTTGEISFRKVDLKFLQQQNTSFIGLVAESRQSLGARGRSDVEVALAPELLKQQQEQQTRHLKQLHQLLIDPIADLLPKDPNQRVIFVPQGEMFLVPFPALLDANNKPLIEKHTILTAPSIQTLELTRQQRDRLTPRQSDASKSLIVGNPIMPKVVTRAGDTPVQLSNLPGAKQEALEIAQLFNTQAITGQQATKDAIAELMPTARLIHFATHGLLDDFKGLGVSGAIALAPSGNGQLNDGLLTSDEILDMKLNAELVVLSACDTGRGRITGDGVIGLSRSLFVAGVPSVIVSLWKVPDDSTALLMTEFYKNLQRSPNKAQALRQAMLTTKQKYPDPLNWAAFTLIGEAE